MDATLASLEHARCTAILRTDDEAVARDAMAAAVRGGFRVIEFTLTTPGAYRLIEEFSKQPGLTVGAGTVLEAGQARAAVEAGARFLVSPVTDPAIIALSLQLGAVAVPGTSTPTEMITAWRAGAQVQKLFPAADKGPEFVKACLGPMPFLRLLPTSGVTADNAVAFLQAGAFAVGFVAPLFDPHVLALRDFRGIEQRAEQLLRAVERALPAQP
ncbi:MAG: bifunctional 4-hydroxy-2-oxoglutarate aldolase/2-dehydro-3-deoxy-phosphogluconate aldolase [Polyangiaceae bacterium]